MEEKNNFHENPVEVRSFDGTTFDLGSVPNGVAKLYSKWKI
jgi:hypothetical protein